MPCAFLQNGFARAMVDREHDAAFQHADVAEDAVSGDVEGTVILVPERVGEVHQEVLTAGQFFVKLLCLFEVGRVVRFGDLPDGRDVIEDRSALPLGVEETADSRVQQQGQTHDQHQKGKK